MTGNWLQMISSTSGKCWKPWWTSTSRTRRSSSRSWWNYYYHFLNHFGIDFAGKSIENFKNCKFYVLRDMLETMVDFDIKDKEASSSWWNYFLSYYTSFQSCFWWEIDCRWFQVPNRHVGHHCGHQVQGVHQVVDKIFFHHVLHYFGLVFDKKSFENYFMYSEFCWTPWWTLTSRKRRSP